MARQGQHKMPSHISSTPASRCRLIPIERFEEDRGTLCVVGNADRLPFEIERVYWIFDVPGGGVRAQHAHRRQHELLVAAHGSFTVECDDGAVRSSYVLDSPDIGLLLPAMVFHHVDSFSPGALCLVLASGPYELDEYVRDLDEFRELLSGK
jgi:dTDP-4-dehydrorhamnose 3,5-epimerase-like enzyme